MKTLRLFFFGALFSCLVAAVDGGAQTNLWRVRLPGVFGDAAPAIAPDGTIYQPTFDGTLLAVTPGGEIIWQFKAGLEIESSPAIGSDGTIYFGSRDRKFYAVTPEGKLKWTFETGAWNDSSPAIAADGTIYFGCWDKMFYALNPDGSLKWKFVTGAVINSSPAIAADGTIYFGSHDQKFYALTPEGKMKWSFATDGTIISSPAINSNSEILFTSGGWLSLRSQTGRQPTLAFVLTRCLAIVTGIGQPRQHLFGRDRALLCGQPRRKKIMGTKRMGLDRRRAGGNGFTNLFRFARLLGDGRDARRNHRLV